MIFLQLVVLRHVLQSYIASSHDPQPHERETGEDLGTSYLEDENNDDISIKSVYVCVYNIIYIYIQYIHPPRTDACPKFHSLWG